MLNRRFLYHLYFLFSITKKIAQSRDPFYLEEKKASKTLNKENGHAPNRSKKISLEGIMGTGKNLAAVLSYEQDSEVVIVGDHIGRYVVTTIDHNTVVLTCGEKTKKLELD